MLVLLGRVLLELGRVLLEGRSLTVGRLVLAEGRLLVVGRLVLALALGRLVPLRLLSRPVALAVEEALLVLFG